MQKELNPELFGTSGLSQSRMIEPEHSPLATQVPWEQKFIELKAELGSIVNQMGRIVGQINEYMKSSQVKMERMQQSIAKLDQSQQVNNADASQKMAHLNQRLGERRTLDLKVQEMVDRHNSVLRGFEVRINHLQKLISEKEAQFNSAQSALSEAKMEIARLKRL